MDNLKGINTWYFGRTTLIRYIFTETNSTFVKTRWITGLVFAKNAKNARNLVVVTDPASFRFSRKMTRNICRLGIFWAQSKYVEILTYDL